MKMARPRHNRRRLKICCSVTAILIIIILIISLKLTVFIPKDASISARAFGVRTMQLALFPYLHLNATLDLEVIYNNPNYGILEYENTTLDVKYHDDLVAKFSLKAQNVPARGQVTRIVLVTVLGAKLMSSPLYKSDSRIGSLNFTAGAARCGRISVMNLVKYKVVTFINCDISIFIKTLKAICTCKSYMKV